MLVTLFAFLYVHPCTSAGIPFIDLNAFTGPNATISTRRKVSQEWDYALRTFGFAAIMNHRVPALVQRDLFDKATSFFSLSAPTKLQARQNMRYGGGGYTPPGVESVSRTMDGQPLPPDLVENFVYLPDTLPLQDNNGTALLHPAIRAMSQSAWEYWNQMHALVEVLHELSAMALGLEDIKFFSEFYDPEPSFALRLAYYPPIETEGSSDNDSEYNLKSNVSRLKRWGGVVKQLGRWFQNMWRRVHRQPALRNESVCSASDENFKNALDAGGVRYGAHTDYQGFTILRPDPTQPGLEVFVPKSPTPGSQVDGQWVPVPEDEIAARNALVINIGDLFQQWTNDRWRSNLHRVRNPAPGSVEATRPRLSLVFFTGPRDDAVIEVLPGCIEPGGVAKHGPVVAGDHLRAKLEASNTGSTPS